MSSILSIDAGTTGTTALVIHQDGSVIGRGYRELPQHFPRPGWVEHDPDGPLPRRHRGRAGGDRPGRRAPCRARDHQPARDDPALGPEDARAAGAGHRLAGSPDRRPLRRAPRAGPRRDAAGKDRPRAGSLLLRDEARADAGRRGGAAPGGTGELAAGTVDSWLVARLTDGAVHVTDHTNASRTMLYGLESRTWDPELLTLFSIPAALLPSIVPSGRGERRVPARAFRPRDADRRDRRGSAVCALRAGVRRGGERQEHLWHRHLPADAHRGSPTALAARPPGHRRLRPPRRTGLRARRQRLHRRRRRPVAPRRPGDRGPRRRVGGAGPQRARHRRRALRPGVRRPRLAPLGGGGARHRHRPDPGDHPRAPGARRARGDGVQQCGAGGH